MVNKTTRESNKTSLWVNKTIRESNLAIVWVNKTIGESNLAILWVNKPNIVTVKYPSEKKPHGKLWIFSDEILEFSNRKYKLSDENDSFHRRGFAANPGLSKR